MNTEIMFIYEPIYKSAQVFQFLGLPLTVLLRVKKSVIAVTINFHR